MVFFASADFNSRRELLGCKMLIVYSLLSTAKKAAVCSKLLAVSKFVFGSSPYEITSDWFVDLGIYFLYFQSHKSEKEEVNGFTVGGAEELR